MKGDVSDNRKKKLPRRMKLKGAKYICSSDRESRRSVELQLNI